MAQGKSDGTVYIDTRMDTNGIEKGVEDTKRKINSVSDSVRKFGDNVKKSFSGAQVGTAKRSYDEVARDIKKAEIQLDRLIEKQIRFVETGGNRKSRTFEGMEYDIEMARNNLFRLQAELGNTEKKAPKSMNMLKKGVENTTKSIKKMGNTSKKANFSILKMLGTSILFSLVFRAISTVTQGFVDGINNLAQYSDKANETMSTLKSSLTQLKNSFATAFMPIITVITPILNGFIQLIIRVNTVIAQFMAALFGKNSYTKAIAIQEDYAKSLNDTASAAKNAKNNLSGLDELTVVSNQESGGGTVSPKDMFEEVSIDSKYLDFVDKLKNGFAKVVDKVKELAAIFKKGFFDGLGDFQPRIETIKNGFDSIKNSLSEIFTDPKVLQSANRYIETLTYSFGQIVGSIASIGLTLGANLIGGLALYLSGNEERIKEYLVSMFDIQTDIVTMAGEWFDSIAYIFEAFASEKGIGFTAGLIGIFSEAFMGLTEFFSSFRRDVLALLTQPIIESKEQIKKALQDMLGGFSSVFSTIKTILEDWRDFIMQIYNEVISPIFDGVIQKTTELLQEHIAPLFSQLGEFLGALGELLTLFWEEILQPLIQWIIDNILPVIVPIMDKIIENFHNTHKVITDLIKGLVQILTELIKFISGLFTVDWKKAWEGIKETFKGIINSMASMLEKFVNNAINLINKLINGINKIASAVGMPSIPKISEVSIPKLAKGAVIPPNAPFMAMLGDQTHGRNLEAPEDLIRQIVREESGLNAEIMDLLAQIAQNTRETADKDLTIGDREIAKANLRGQSSMGYSLILEG